MQFFSRDRDRERRRSRERSPTRKRSRDRSPRRERSPRRPRRVLPRYTVQFSKFSLDGWIWSLLIALNAGIDQEYLPVFRMWFWICQECDCWCFNCSLFSSSAPAATWWSCGGAIRVSTFPVTSLTRFSPGWTPSLLQDPSCSVTSATSTSCTKK